MSTPHPAPYGPRGARWPLALYLATALLALPACSEVQKSKQGQRCAADQPCAAGLRCSYKKKRCYRPVDCKRLAKRLETCTKELLEIWSPASKALPAAKRVSLLTRVREHLKTEVVEHCRFDAAAYKRKHGGTPPKSKSYGEDRDGDTLNGCLAKGPCADFARCFLTTARLIGDPRPAARRFPVFPVALPRPTPDGGVPATAPDAGAGKAETARPAPKAETARPTPKPETARPTPKPETARPAPPAPRPR